MGRLCFLPTVSENNIFCRIGVRGRHNSFILIHCTALQKYATPRQSGWRHNSYNLLATQTKKNPEGDCSRKQNTCSSGLTWWMMVPFLYLRVILVGFVVLGKDIRTLYSGISTSSKPYFTQRLASSSASAFWRREPAICGCLVRYLR